jgi:hypothetical protein
VKELIDLLKKQLPTVPEDWRHKDTGQTFDERCEAWLQNAIDQLEEELGD